jgi:DNA-binding GntR family transcriptional regulator
VKAMRSRSDHSLVDGAYADLQQRIASGALHEGERLVIDRLALEFGTSLIPIREALGRLHAERFVTFERNKGYRVAKKPGVMEMRHLFQARLIIETGAVESGADNISDTVIAHLVEINRRLAAVLPAETPDAVKQFISLNEAFHICLVSLSDNPFVIDSYNRLGYHQRVMHTQYATGVPNGDSIIEEHQGIILALQSKNRYLMGAAIRAHISAGFEILAADPDGNIYRQ